MKIFPAIDIIDNKAVRLFKGDYNQKTIYNENPLEVAKDFEAKGAKFIHIVDLDAAKSGQSENFDIIKEIALKTSLFVEVGGGIRNEEIVQKYLENGINRVIIGTAAVTNIEFFTKMIKKYKEKIAAQADIKDGFLAIKGWIEKSNLSLNEFAKNMQDLGIKTLLCTDISKDGAMQGTNLELYKKLKQNYNMEIIASGGVSSLEDIKALKQMQIDGAIIGKAYYTGALDLKEAINLAKEEKC